MDLQKENAQRQEFRNILYELAKSQELLENSITRSGIYKRLEELYYDENPDKRFRHFYSDIFSVLTQIRENPKLGNIDILGQNLTMIRNGYKPKNMVLNGKDIDISDSIKKLYDHVSLDIARIRYLEGEDKDISGETSLKKLQTQINSLQDQTKDMQTYYDETKKKIDKVKNKVSKSQREYIAILGIFAAVVLAFFSGSVFSTSLLENVLQANLFRIVLTALVIGTISVNLLFALMYYVDKLVNEKGSVKPLLIANAVCGGTIAVVVILRNLQLLI